MTIGGVYLLSIEQYINPQCLEFIKNYSELNDWGTLQPFISPPNSTEIAPEFKEGMVPIFDGEKWTLFRDYRNQTLYQCDTNVKEWLPLNDYIGELADDIKVTKPEIYETPSGVDLESLRNFKK